MDNTKRIQDIETLVDSMPGDRVYIDAINISPGQLEDIRKYFKFSPKYTVSKTIEPYGDIKRLCFTRK